MRVIRKIGDEIREVEYPHIDISKPVYGLQEGIIYYFIQDIDRPEYDSNMSYLKPFQNLTEKKHPEYNHLLICERGFEIINYNQSAIIEKLNISLGNHLDINYLPQTRVKHSDELNGIYGEISQDRKDYILSLKNWQMKCINDRDLREDNYINNGIFPSFTFDEMPIKTF